MSSGLKLAYGFRAWDWKGRKLPPAALVLSHRTDLPDLRMQRPVMEGVYLYAAPGDPQYAALTTDSGERVACAAHGAGGTLDIVCDSPRPGVLALAENSWSGWRADRRPAGVPGSSRRSSSGGP